MALAECLAQAVGKAFRSQTRPWQLHRLHHQGTATSIHSGPQHIDHLSEGPSLLLTRCTGPLAAGAFHVQLGKLALDQLPLGLVGSGLATNDLKNLVGEGLFAMLTDRLL